MASADKSEFRKTKVWIEFSRNYREKVGKCECCGKKAKVLQLHHAVPDDYENLDPKNFWVLCSMCHKVVSFLERVKPENYGRYNPKFVEFFSTFLRPKE